MILEMKHMTKSFPGVQALCDVSIALGRGSVHALMGENGAGKSTLMKCLFGIYTPDKGEIILDGVPRKFKSPSDALQSGVAMVHQELNQALKRTVMDNMWLGRYPMRGPFVDEKKMLADTRAVFETLGLSLDPLAVMGSLSVSKRQMAEIAKAVSYNAKVIVLDEPTSSLNEQEVSKLFEIIRTLQKKGCGILYISHKMSEILEISDTVTVLRDGRFVATKPAKELDPDSLIRMMVGRSLSGRFPQKTNTPGETVLEVKGLTARNNVLKDVSFSARKGEILGISGLDGSGRTELLENLFGLSERQSGKICFQQREIRNRTPREAIKNGFALVTEERRAGGIFGVLSIRENTVISSLKKHKKFGLLQEKSMKQDTKWAIDTLKTKTAGQSAKIRTLSGGNQQKVIFGRWLLTEPDILLLDEPTRGIDIGAKYEIYKLIIELAEKGKTVLLVSSEMPELLGLSDRILVLSGGKTAGIADTETVTQEELLRLAGKYV
ncbi:MAG: ATP-binding cassette domain-containing protein [Clostridia bacterium]|nr:ATP-binding cassette domain-containing protein [Clostridia bacterium]